MCTLWQERAILNAKDKNVREGKWFKMQHNRATRKDDDTQILPPLDVRAASSAAFHAMLLHYGLTIGQIAQAARVPQIIIWRVDHGLPISSSSAVAVRAGLQRLTGVFYTAPIAVYSGRNKEGKGA